LKKQDKHPIDQFFKENTEVHFPYDPNLWNKADADLNALAVKKRLWAYSTIVLSILAVVMCWFWLNSEKETTVSSSNEADNSASVEGIHKHLSVEGKLSQTNKHSTSGTNSTIKISGTENDLNTKQIHDPNAQNLISLTKPVVESSSQTINSTNNTDTESKPEISSNQKEETFTTDESTKSVKLNFETIAMPSISGIKIPFTYLNSNTTPNNHDFWPAPKRFATYVELENYTSILLRQKNSGLSDAELDLKQKYETPQNLTGFSLNVLLQRGGFGVIIGLGHSQTAMNTNYRTDTGYKLVSTTTKYKMIQDSVKYSGGYYSHIMEYDEKIYEPLPNLNGNRNRNTFRWLQVPVRVSYQYNRNRIRFAMRAGIDLMYLYKAEGAYINSSLDGLTAIGSGNQTLKRWNMNGSVQLMTGIQLNKYWQIGAQGFYNQQLGSNFSKYNSRFQAGGIGWYLRKNIR